MCGIVGYVGENQCSSILVDGLKKLEYRGYDSVGIAVMNKKEITLLKKKGRVKTIEEDAKSLKGVCGIGHTRWATHGRPSDNNSHPHKSGKFAVVHNGIIENFLELKIALVNDGVKFLSDTDTEVIAHLLDKNYDGDFLKTVKKTIDSLKGSYALAILCDDNPNEIAVAKKDSPLIIGKGKGENFIASDIPAIADKTKDVFYLEDGEFALIDKDKIVFYNKNLKTIQKECKTVDLTADEMSKGKYESFMLKEIYEIPRAIEDTVKYLQDLKPDKAFYKKLKSAKQITIVGCGTAYNSGLVGKRVIEKVANRFVDIDIASEFRYKDPIIEKDSVIIAVSQSGETADTIAAIKLAKEKGAYVIAITNVLHSQIVKVSDFALVFKAGQEVAVAATKSYNCQLVCFYYLAQVLANLKGKKVDLLGDILKIPALLKSCDFEQALIDFAGTYSSVHSVFFLGRGLDYSVAVEGSLKLKEISYIHSEGYPSGELKHGTLALIEKDTLSIVLLTQKELLDKTMNAVHEVKSRGAVVLGLTQFDDVLENEFLDMAIKLPKIDDIYMPIIEIVPLQLFSYYMARSRGCDADKPRNLAKSVTVE